MLRNLHLLILAASLTLCFYCCSPHLATARERAIDGTNNNVLNPSWGAAGTQLLRHAPADYPGDGSGASFLESPQRPNPRTISNVLSTQTSSLPDARGMQAGTWQWGQFIDHDIDLTFNGAGYGSAAILVPQPDPNGMTMIPTNRSAFDPSTGTEASNPRQQINSITSYLDASNVYGSDAIRATALRTMSGGLMKMSSGDLLPLNTDDSELGALPNDDGGTGATMFLAGDIRANEQLGLTAMHTIFLREHNRLASALAIANAGDTSWDDERLYQTARKVVGAEIQAITYNEFLPALLGPYAPRADDYSYDPSVNAAATNEFSTAFYRLGHSMIGGALMLAGNGGVVDGQLALRDVFFRPDRILAEPELVEKSLMGLAMQPSQMIDLKLVDDLRNFLFAPSGGIGLDLAALNIQRGRDHGLADYNTFRTMYGLPNATNMADITSDPVVQSALLSLYGNISNIDPWVGALAEDHVDGTSVGPLILNAVADQFTRLRDGDAFFYTGDADLLSSDIAAMIDFDQLTMMDLLSWNTSFNSMPDSFFMAVPEPAGTVLVAMVAFVACIVNRRHRGSILVE